MSLRVLYIANPKSIHDRKWIEYLLDKGISAYSFSRKPALGYKFDGVTFLGHIPDFSIIRFLSTLITVIRIKKNIRKHNIQLIHIMYAEPNALWSIFRYYFDIPIVLTCRGTDVLKTIPNTFESKSILNKLVSKLYKIAFKKVDFITATSQIQIDAISKIGSIVNKSEVIRTGVNLNKIQQNTSADFPNEIVKPFILFPRGIAPIYNHEFSLAAIDLLPVSIKINYLMVFIGKIENASDYQNHLVEKMKRMADVEFLFLGNQSQSSIFELNKRASLVVMNPKSDGSPVSAMEAIACGAHVILGPLQYDKEVYSESTTVLKSWSTKELALVIEKKINNVKKTALSPNTLNKIDQKQNMNSLLTIYEQLIK